jgi:hypothetical protein
MFVSGGKCDINIFAIASEAIQQHAVFQNFKIEYVYYLKYRYYVIARSAKRITQQFPSLPPSLRAMEYGVAIHLLRTKCAIKQHEVLLNFKY